MIETKVTFNNKEYTAIYNKDTGYFEVELEKVNIGGIYNTNLISKNLLNEETEELKKIQILAKEQLKIDLNKVFMWIFDCKYFSVKDIVEIADYDINIDEETNANSIIKVLKKTSAKARDIIAVKKNNNKIYWGTINNIENNNGSVLYEYNIKYITNLFDQNVKLENENLIKTKGIEDFIAKSITDNFISNTDTFINKDYLQIVVKTHTPKQVSVTNAENGIYNLHTYMTNCTQNYNIVYDFSIVNKKLVITIENKELKKELIDTQAQNITNYTEVFETDVVSKVIVLTSTNTYTLYLKNDRSTTENMNDLNRADGKIETIYTEKYEDAKQSALDVMKSNSYNHNITFKYDKYLKVGTPIAIKTKESIILDTYISSIRITQNRFYEYICGNIRIKFIEKLLKERK